jgi:hypothetical protein
MSLIPVQRAIGLKLVLEDPLVGDDIAPRRPRNQVPRVVGLQGLILLHSTTLVGFCERATDRGLDRRQHHGSSSSEEL